MSDVSVAAETGAEAPAPPAGAELDSMARAMGWRPKEEFKGDQSKWTDAETFVAERWDALPKTRRALKDVTAKLDNLTAKFEEQGQLLQDYKKFMTGAEQRAYLKAKADLEAKRDVAVASADTDGFKAVQKEIDALEKDAAKVVQEGKRDEQQRQDAPPPPQSQGRAPPPHPAIAEWMDRNTWYNDDDMLHGVAVSIDNRFRKDHPGMDLGERLELVTEEVKRRFPEKFTNPRRERAGAVEQPGGAPPSRQTNKRSYENLPPEAKKACDKFVSQKLMTRDDYVRDYPWD